MDNRYITIDGGTTNTRFSYVENGKILETIKVKCGSNPKESSMLYDVCKANIANLTQKYGTPLCIIGCGMITSEYGLKNIPHIIAPAGVSDFHDGMEKIYIDSISNLPIYLIPGLKIGGDDFLKVNIMRGEETEIIGLCETLNSDTIYVLPGSHSKLIQINDNGKICYIRSFMTGEMRASLSQYTILSGSLDSDETINEEYLKLGFEFTKTNGINESLLKVRTMDILFHKTKSKIYSFFMGCILEAEVSEIIKAKENIVIIGGQKKLKEITSELVNIYSDKKVISLPDEICNDASIYGMIKIFEYKA